MATQEDGIGINIKPEKDQVRGQMGMGKYLNADFVVRKLLSNQGLVGESPRLMLIAHCYQHTVT